MIHGGMRYLLYDIPTTRVSSEDAGRIRRIAPHITWRIPFLWPLYPGGLFMREATEAFLSAYDPHAKRKGGLQHSRLSAAEAHALEPGLAPNVQGALTLDEWGCDVYRLAALNALDAKEHGAQIFTHTEVMSVLRAGRDVRGVRVRDRLTGSARDVEARLVVNAAGPWVPAIAQLADTIVQLRPGKGIHVTFERRIGNYGMILEGVDGRTMFLVPHGAETIVGTTDDDYYGDPTLVNLDISRDEIDYVIEAAARALPQARTWRPLRAWAGVRNTVFEWGVDSTIGELGRKARDGKLTLEDLSGGTFTISNGGVYGSLLSTPILNPPQSAILGMHKTQERPVVVNGKIEARPMMYLALSYDHRIVDGKEAVTFLVRVKEVLEDPQRAILDL
jgi:glycerol-3-phosphate dehydrogenase